MKTKQSYAVAGTNAHRVDGIEKVTGKAVYTTDLQLPGMAHARDPQKSGGARDSSSKSMLPRRKRFRE